jgi:hypothetical protein
MVGVENIITLYWKESENIFQAPTSLTGGRPLNFFHPSELHDERNLIKNKTPYQRCLIF